MNNILNAQNPFFGQYQTPHGTVPFDRIKTEHYEPAILEGIKQQNAELDAIIQNPEKATFTNTIEAYEQSGRLLDRVTTYRHWLRKSCRYSASTATISH